MLLIKNQKKRRKMCFLKKTVFYPRWKARFFFQENSVFITCPSSFPGLLDNFSWISNCGKSKIILLILDFLSLSMLPNRPSVSCH